MLYLARLRLSRVLLMCAISLLALNPAVSDDLAMQRTAYSDAVAAIDRGHWTEYRRLRSTLDDYPLAIYLDYFTLSRQKEPIAPGEALDFIDRSAGSPLANRFLGRYLGELGKAQRWQAFLQAKPDEPNSTELKCYFFRAQLAQGNKEVAWEGATRLWVQGSSQPAACDPLFASWRAEGGARCRGPQRWPGRPTSPTCRKSFMLCDAFSRPSTRILAIPVETPFGFETLIR